MKLTGNTVLITGATSGLGLAFAQKFYEAGNIVIACGRRRDRLNDLEKKYPGMVGKICDVADTAEREELLNWVVQNHPETNVLLNNAGIQLDTDLTNPCNLNRVRSEVETNLIAPIHLASLFAPHLRGKDNAAIINISSGLAFVPLAFMPVYCATKAAIHSITLSLRHQLKDSGIKVFEIAPPSVDTELGHDRRADKTQSHGGIPIAEFIGPAMQGLADDVYETAVGQSNVLRAKREELFESMNSRVAG